jgi:hypothetical protein
MWGEESKKKKREIKRNITLLAAYLFDGWGYFSTLKMEAILSSEMSLNLYQVIWRHIPEDVTLREEIRLEMSYPAEVHNLQKPFLHLHYKCF